MTQRVKRCPSRRGADPRATGRQRSPIPDRGGAVAAFALTGASFRSASPPPPPTRPSPPPPRHHAAAVGRDVRLRRLVCHEPPGGCSRVTSPPYRTATVRNRPTQTNAATMQTPLNADRSASPQKFFELFLALCAPGCTGIRLLSVRLTSPRGFGIACRILDYAP